MKEAATLVGMCKNPSLYNPVRYNERSRGRRNVVLDRMRKAGYITVEERDSLQALPLKLSYHRVDITKVLQRISVIPAWCAECQEAR